MLNRTPAQLLPNLHASSEVRGAYLLNLIFLCQPFFVRLSVKKENPPSLKGFPHLLRLEFFVGLGAMKKSFLKMSAQKQLDELLGLYIESQNINSSVRIVDLKEKIELLYSDLDYMAIEKFNRHLYEDGFITVDDEKDKKRLWYFYITIDGELFYNDGGYSGEICRGKLQKYLRTLQATVITVGSLFAAAYSIKQIFFVNETAETIIHYHIF